MAKEVKWLQPHPFYTLPASSGTKCLFFFFTIPSSVYWGKKNLIFNLKKGFVEKKLIGGKNSQTHQFF